MAGVFGRWDWVANSVLFGLYHVHKIWAWPSMITSGFGMAKGCHVPPCAGVSDERSALTAAAL
jgi:hypothetical protein